MGLFSSFFGLFGSDASSMDSISHSVCDGHSINPANGLPMAGCVDIEGNAFGTSGIDDTFSSTSMFDDSFSSGSSFDDW